ncbi:hypothetical protein PAXINDRAFT_7778 [Paxillus involutus ATCC 200175]|nr:hypothetical protein PAXINDRAFT_7778 [Paxillus involutus ATCC 200175]
MEIIQTVLSDHHFYAGVYKHAYEVLQQHEQVEDVVIRLHCAPGQDRCRHNLPTADEIAVVLSGDGSQPHDSRDIILRLWWPDGPLQCISEGHSAYACLHYTVFFPYGEDGWHWGLWMPEPNQDREITQALYYSYWLYTQRAEFNTILRGCRLLQQYIVDMWATTDQNCL